MYMDGVSLKTKYTGTQVVGYLRDILPLDFTLHKRRVCPISRPLLLEEKAKYQCNQHWDEESTCYYPMLVHFTIAVTGTVNLRRSDTCQKQAQQAQQQQQQHTYRIKLATKMHINKKTSSNILKCKVFRDRSVSRVVMMNLFQLVRDEPASSFSSFF
jgi:hypothetical protein